MGLKRNIKLSVLIQFLPLIGPILILPLVTRYLSKVEYGQYAFTYSLALYASILANFGLHIYGTRILALKDDLKYKTQKLKELFKLNIVITLWVLTIYIFGILFLEGNKILWLLQGLHILFVPLDLNWYYTGIENQKPNFNRALLQRIALLILVYGLIPFYPNAETFAICQVVALVAGLCCYIPGLPRSIKNVSIKGHLKKCFPYFLPQISIQIYALLDRFLLGSLGTKTMVADYDLGYKVVFFSLLGITGVGTVLMPRITYMQQKGENTDGLISKSFLLISLFAILSCFFFQREGAKLLVLFFGDKYLGAFGVLFPLTYTIIILGWSNIASLQLMIPLGKNKLLFYSTLSGALFNVIGNLIVIPKYGAVGVAWITVFTEGLVLLIQIVGLWKDFNWVQNLVKVGPFFIILLLIFILPPGLIYSLIISCVFLGVVFGGFRWKLL
jgi:O-antigen/teichoic acid export membrane protein